MQPVPSHSGEMPQDPGAPRPHPSDVLTIDPVARRSRQAYNALSASSVGIEMGLSVVLGVLGGMWLDTRLGATPWLMMLGMGLGLVAGLRSVLRAVKRAEKAAASG